MEFRESPLEGLGGVNGTLKRIDLDFYRGKRVLVTGHTGFKGTWLCRILLNAGAQVLGYSRCSEKDPDFFALAEIEGRLRHVRGDIRDYAHLEAVFQAFQPELVFHLAAQPIVRESYSQPLATYETNVMGTVHVLECVRRTPSVKSVLNVTTDKVYLNNDQPRAFREEDPLDGFDPYSNSKSCSELVTHSYVRSFFSAADAPAVSTARAGNVIGGGDFAKDRILPDCVRAVSAGKAISVRNPDSTRPYQHVLEPLSVYLMIARAQYEDRRFAGAYNVGPNEGDCLTTGELAELFCASWGPPARWEHVPETGAPHEAKLLGLDCGKLKETFGWSPRWDIRESVDYTCRFGKVWLAGGDIPAEMDAEIRRFMEE